MPDSPYRAPLPVEPDPYVKAWVDWKRRRALIMIAGAFGSLWVPIFHEIGVRHWVVLSVLTALVTYGFASAYLRAFRCPACGRAFQARWLTAHAIALRCGSCGIAVGAPKLAAVEAEQGRAVALPREESPARTEDRIEDAEADAMDAEAAPGAEAPTP